MARENKCFPSSGLEKSQIPEFNEYFLMVNKNFTLPLSTSNTSVLLRGIHPTRRTSIRRGKNNYNWALSILNSSTIKIVPKIPAIQLPTILYE